MLFVLGLCVCDHEPIFLNLTKQNERLDGGRGGDWDKVSVNLKSSYNSINWILEKLVSFVHSLSGPLGMLNDLGCWFGDEDDDDDVRWMALNICHVVFRRNWTHPKQIGRWIWAKTAIWKGLRAVRVRCRDPNTTKINVISMVNKWPTEWWTLFNCSPSPLELNHPSQANLIVERIVDVTLVSCVVWCQVNHAHPYSPIGAVVVVVIFDYKQINLRHCSTLSNVTTIFSHQKCPLLLA